MTYEEIVNIPAGEEMDDLIAEYVMGWHKGVNEYGSAGWLDSNEAFAEGRNVDDLYEDGEDFHIFHFHPSQSLLWTGTVTKKIKRMWNMTYLPEDDIWEVGFVDEAPLIIFEADTFELAVCRRALLWAMEKK